MSAVGPVDGHAPSNEKPNATTLPEAPNDVTLPEASSNGTLPEAPSPSLTPDQVQLSNESNPKGTDDNNDSTDDDDDSTDDDDEQNEKSSEEMADQGSLCQVKTLYEGPKKCECCINWVEEPPKDLNQTEGKADMKKHAFIIRMKKNHDDGKPLVLHSIVIQSPHLKKLLEKVLDGCGGITPTLKKVVLKAPFWVFYYRWDIFKETVQHQLYPDAARQAKLFYTTLKKELHSTVTEIKDLLKNNVITFKTLWALFEPGTTVYHYANGHDRFYRVDDCKYRHEQGCGDYLVIIGQYIDWDGKRFGFVRDHLVIPEFIGTMDIPALPAFPAQYHGSIEKVCEKVLARGLHFENLSGFHYASYTGTVRWMDRGGSEDKLMLRNVDGRVVVDAESHALFNPRDKIKASPLDLTSAMPLVDFIEEAPSRPHDKSYERLFKELEKTNGRKLPGALLLLCTPRVRGYCLKIKHWVELDVDCVRDIKWNDAFKSLVLPNDYKEMILSFIESQVANKGAFDDIVEGKGQGIIIMLAGTPGVGKTLTAEAVADKLRRPLYMLSTGELGVDADDVEHNLRMVLDIAARWDAVLLIDESDVFLEKRSTHDLARNKIVAVFLRLLEYYSGIMFMTTNRSDALDPAFQSRIHLTIHYPPLDEAAKRRIWLTLVDASQHPNELDETDFEYLASLDMNGRQIKNTIKTAQLLACREKVALHRKHFDQVLRITQGVSHDTMEVERVAKQTPVRKFSFSAFFSRRRWVFRPRRQIHGELRSATAKGTDGLGGVGKQDGCDN